MDRGAEHVFNNYPSRYREPLLQIRALIYDVADRIPEVDAVEESLKWGQPSYAVRKAGTGTPIRLDRYGEDQVALFFHCQTTLVSEFRTLFYQNLEFSNNRAIVLNLDKELPVAELSLCIEMALTYHLKK